MWDSRLRSPSSNKPNGPGTLGYTVFDVPLKPSTNLTGSFDLEALVARFPDHYCVKGMFCSRIAEQLGDQYSAISPQLSAAPRAGRYLPFKDYPQADYTRLVVGAAKKLFPELGLSEATRRVARDDFRTFARSTWGKVALTLVGDARTALLHMPEAFARAAPGPALHVDERDSRTVRITLLRHRGAVEYMLGQLEGIVMSYDHTPVTVIRQSGPDTLDFDVDHGD